MAWPRDRTRVIAIVLLVIVIATSIALRKAVPNQTTRMAIGMVEVVLIAILAVGIVRSR
jgi:hypothetical protein